MTEDQSLNTHIKYQEFIREHKNYSFLPLEHKKNWVSVSKNGIHPRKKYWDNHLNICIENGVLPYTSKYVNLARYIHPTKVHICQCCNVLVSIYQVYPNKNTLKWLNKKFNIIPDKYETIFDIYTNIKDEFNSTKDQIFNEYFTQSIDCLKKDCYNDNYKGIKLSPGVMANPPDRLDGFHSYNSICGCRQKNDKGRSVENMKSYTRDRRCYELYTDGNKLLANLIMGKINMINIPCPICKNKSVMTADHIGPISLGFVHDPINFQVCCGPCNSSKNNRITKEDIDKLCVLENSGNQVISWWAKSTWDNNKDNDINIIKVELDKNTKKFLEVMDWLKENKMDVISKYIEEFDTNNTSYTIQELEVNENTGDITYTCKKTVSTKKTKKIQQDRINKILCDKSKKKNRNIKVFLSEKNISLLKQIHNDNFKHIICTVLQE